MELMDAAFRNFFIGTDPMQKFHHSPLTILAGIANIVVGRSVGGQRRSVEIFAGTKFLLQAALIINQMSIGVPKQSLGHCFAAFFDCGIFSHGDPTLIQNCIAILCQLRCRRTKLCILLYDNRHIGKLIRRVRCEKVVIAAREDTGALDQQRASPVVGCACSRIVAILYPHIILITGVEHDVAPCFGPNFIKGEAAKQGERYGAGKPAIRHLFHAPFIYSVAVFQGQGLWRDRILSQRFCSALFLPGRL